MASESQGLASFPPVRWAMVHPRLAAWIVLSVGMIVLLVIEARDVGLLPGQWIALIAACVVVAGLCIWIISWEDGDDEDDLADADVDSGKDSA
ncbi:MAG: hypothetical protein KJ065_02645 [Anaerolineae bacterium]|nr:hypothetical protein [Anaerolineae bacterium]